MKFTGGLHVEQRLLFGILILSLKVVQLHLFNYQKCKANIAQVPKQKLSGIFDPN